MVIQINRLPPLEPLTGRRSQVFGLPDLRSTRRGCRHALAVLTTERAHEDERGRRQLGPPTKYAPRGSIASTTSPPNANDRASAIRIADSDAPKTRLRTWSRRATLQMPCSATPPRASPCRRRPSGRPRARPWCDADQAQAKTDHRDPRSRRASCRSRRYRWARRSPARRLRPIRR